MQGDYLDISNLASLDFNLEARFLWINLTLAALSKALETACKFFGLGFLLASLSNFLRLDSLRLLRAVRVLSLRIFLIADFIIGIMLTSKVW